jgi:3-isopropylmalate/(R)-2-methylmalate dehydratase small subunit
MQMHTGKTFRLGDNVDTDVIIPARYLTTFDPEVLKLHCLEDLDPGFAAKVRPGDMIVAGANFGCGSSREHAPLAIKAAGVSVVIAKSFARIFYRNSFNIGLPILESAEAAAAVADGDELEVDLAAGRIKDLTTGAEFSASPLPEFMQELINDGGLIAHTQKRLAAGLAGPPTPVAETPEAVVKPRGTRMREIEAAAAQTGPGRDAPWVEERPKSTEPELGAGEDDEEEEEESEESGAS